MNEFFISYEDVGLGCYTAKEWGQRPVNMARVDAGERFYINNENRTYRGATYLADLVQGISPENKHLQSWRKDMLKKIGSEGLDEWMRNVADFGTLDHEAFNSLLNGELTFQKLSEMVSSFLETSEVPKKSFSKVLQKASKDILAFRAFLVAHDVKVYALEQMVFSDELGVATPIDVVCTLNIDGKMYWGLVNIKSSENAQNHLTQCAIEYMCARTSILEHMLNISKLPVKVLTLRPVDWKGSPKFELKDYTPQIEDEITNVRAVAEVAKRKGTFAVPGLNIPTWDGPLTLFSQLKTINAYDRHKV
jgi:hypothetical protein